MADPLRILVDLNVALDVVQKREPFYADSADVLDAVANKRVVGFLAAHSITTLFYVLRRQYDRPTAVFVTRQILDAFSIAPVDDTVIRQALAWGWRDFEDAAQMAAAVHANLDYLVTRNPKDFQTQPVPILRPAHLLPLLAV